MAACPQFCPWLASLLHRISTSATHALPCLPLMLMARATTRRLSKLLRISDCVYLPNSAPPGTPLHHPLVPYSQAVAAFCICNPGHPSQAPCLSFPLPWLRSPLQYHIPSACPSPCNSSVSRLLSCLKSFNIYMSPSIKAPV